MSTKTDPRAEFAALSDDELRDELHVATERARIALGNASRPTRDGVEAKIATAQARAAKRFDSLANQAMDAALNAVPGSQAAGRLHEAAIAAFVASDGFAHALRKSLAANLPTEAELEPYRREHAACVRRIEAIEAELKLRALDAEQAEHEAQRAELVERLKG